jgi:uncharacterized FlaG/YvyC family protein
MIILAQSFPQPTAGEFWAFLICVIFVAGMVALYFRIKADRKKANESDEPRRTILPSPLSVRTHEDFVTIPAFMEQNKRRDKELKDMEERLEKRIDSHETVVRDRLHKISGEVHAATLEAKEGREIATEQFQNIEGRLGELKSTTEHTNALAIRTDQAVREIPEKIAAAVARQPRR